MFQLIARLFKRRIANATRKETMITIAEAIARAAESKVGVRESGGPNKGPALQPFFDADIYDPNGPKPGDDGYAWCASFVCWCVLVATLGRSIPFARPRTARAWGMEEWAREQAAGVNLRRPHARDVRRGDIVVFQFSHVGIAVGSPDAEGFVETVEGNTNGSGSREGDGVYQKRRHLGSIRSRIRIA